MRIVKCYECGKRYNYDEDGFCPGCGAFNQPTARSRIGADGSVVRVEGINRRNHEGAFVHQEYHGENRERKRTPLEQELPKRANVKRMPPRPAPTQTIIRQPLRGRDGLPVHHATTKKKQNGKGALTWIIVILAILLKLLGDL